MSKNEVQRNYSFSDSMMLRESGVMNGLFLEDKSIFSSFDNSFDDEFYSSWNKKIGDATNINVDSVYETELTEKTKLVQAKLAESRTHFQKMKYFVEKAFPGREEIYNQFGLKDYNDARNSEIKMAKLLGIAYNAAVQFKNELITAGLAETDINKLINLQSELSAADLEQEKAKKKRPVITQERVKQLNDCYSFMQKVSKAAKIIFAEDYSKYTQYLLPNEKYGKEELTKQQDTDTDTTKNTTKSTSTSTSNT